MQHRRVHTIFSTDAGWRKQHIGGVAGREQVLQHVCVLLKRQEGHLSGRRASCACSDMLQSVVMSCTQRVVHKQRLADFSHASAAAQQTRRVAL